MADVFISYARLDKARVAPLVAAIEARGWTVWWDPDITPGQEFDSQIEDELQAADRDILVPVRFEGARLPMDVRAIHTIDLDSWAGSAESPAFQDLCRALESMVSRQRRTAPAPAAAKPSSRT